MIVHIRKSWRLECAAQLLRGRGLCRFVFSINPHVPQQSVCWIGFPVFHRKTRGVFHQLLPRKSWSRFATSDLCVRLLVCYIGSQKGRKSDYPPVRLGRLVPVGIGRGWFLAPPWLTLLQDSLSLEQGGKAKQPGRTCAQVAAPKLRNQAKHAL